jgi:hypothetical protein
VAAYQPKDNSESESRCRQGRDYVRRGLVEVENDEPANESQQCDQDNRPDLNDSAAMVPDHQQGVLEFERDQDGEHHSEEALEDLGIGGIDQMAADKFECVEN